MTKKLSYSELAKLSWKDREYKIQRLKEGQERRKLKLKKLGLNYHTDEQRKLFALAKCKSANNCLGYYIISNYDINYSLIRSKIKQTYDKIYKDEQNLINQLESIRAIIINECNKDIELGKMIELSKESLRLRGVV